MTDNVLMEEMTWQEIAEAMAGGKTTALLAVGSTEQHGPHLPTGTDAILGTKLAELTARELGTALVAPTMRPGLSGHHVGFPGTFTVSPNLFTSWLKELCLCLKDHGFKDIVLISSHGGNTDTMVAFLPYIARTLAPECRVHMLNMPVGHSTALIEANRKIFDREGISLPKAGVHAGWAETCQLLAFCPDIVDMDRAVQGLADPSFYEPVNLRKSQTSSFVNGVKSQTKTGILGDPRGANAEIGHELNKLFAVHSADEIRSLLS